MSVIDEIVAYNKDFVASKGFEPYVTDKYPNKRLAIVTCMDTRLTKLLPAALGLENGDAKIIKNAGGVIASPFDSTMRSLLVAIYELGVRHVMVIGHTNCGAQHMNAPDMIAAMRKAGVAQGDIDLMRYCGVDFERWLAGFGDGEQSVRNSMAAIRENPLITDAVEVRGFIIDSVTGALQPVE